MAQAKDRIVERPPFLAQSSSSIEVDKIVMITAKQVESVLQLVLLSNGNRQLDHWYSLTRNQSKNMKMMM